MCVLILNSKSSVILYSDLSCKILMMNFSKLPISLSKAAGIISLVSLNSHHQAQCLWHSPLDILIYYNWLVATAGPWRMKKSINSKGTKQIIRGLWVEALG